MMKKMVKCASFFAIFAITYTPTYAYELCQHDRTSKSAEFKKVSKKNMRAIPLMHALMMKL